MRGCFIVSLLEQNVGRGLSCIQWCRVCLDNVVPHEKYHHNDDTVTSHSYFLLIIWGEPILTLKYNHNVKYKRTDALSLWH